MRSPGAAVSPCVNSATEFWLGAGALAATVMLTVADVEAGTFTLLTVMPRTERSPVVTPLREVRVDARHDDVVRHALARPGGGLSALMAAGRW